MILINVAAAFPAKLLRIPKIYNALITSKEKILPSEAYPASTGPIFQPIGLAGGTVFIQPEIIIDGPKPEDYDVKEGDDVKIPWESMRKSKYPEPLTFFPRYSVYYPSQPHLIIQQPFIYTTIEDPESSRRIQTKSANRQPLVDRELENEERKDLSYQKSKMKSKSSPATISREYVKNNRPADRSIPDIQPPPPPIRYRDAEDEDGR